MSLDESLSRVVSRHAELSALLSENPAGDVIVKLSTEYSELTPVVNAINAYNTARDEAVDLASMLTDPDTDAEMKEMAEEELRTLKDSIPQMERDVQILLLPKDAADDKNAILEVRAGTGGDEAALFAADLMRMYQRYADTLGWKFELIEANETGIGGYKEAVANVSGKGVFAKLKYESGVYWVQRVPEMESGGRIHTSAATVAVLPEAEDVDIKVENKDLCIDTYCA